MKGIFFDLDGVLVLTENTHFSAWNNIMRKNNLPEDFFHLEQVIGVSDHARSEEIIRHFHLAQDPKSLSNEKREIYYSMIKQHLEFPKGRDAFLQSLYGKYVMGVISSSTKGEIETVLKLEKIEKYFSFIVGYEDTKEHKPNPAPYLLALQKSKLKPHEVIAIEDSPPGIMSAKRANLKVLCLTTTLTEKEGKELGAICYSDFSKIMEDKAIME